MLDYSLCVLCGERLLSCGEKWLLPSDRLFGNGGLTGGNGQLLFSIFHSPDFILIIVNALYLNTVYNYSIC
jgi:hypothetical protein